MASVSAASTGTATTAGGAGALSISLDVPRSFVVSSSEPDTFETPDPLVAEGLVSDNKESGLYATALGGVVGTSTASTSATFQKQVESGQLSLDKSSLPPKEAQQIWQVVEAGKLGSKKFGSRTEYEVLQSRYQRFESPLQRFQRLQMEINDFKNDLDQVAQDGNKPIDQGVTPAEILGELSKLQTELQTIMKTDSAQKAVTAALENQVTTKETSQQKRSEVLLRELQNLTPSPAATSQPAAAGSNATDERVTYELYYRPGIHNARDGQVARLFELERRISELETTLAGQSKLKNPLPSSVMTVLEELEKKVSLLDETRLEMLKLKLQTLTFNMEDALLKNQDSAKTHKIEQLYDLMIKWDGTWQQLPTIVSRLQALRALHEQCASVGETIARLEKEQTNLSTATSSNAAFLQQLQQNFKTNLQTINDNMVAVQQRIDALVAKHSK